MPVRSLIFGLTVTVILTGFSFSIISAAELKPEYSPASILSFTKNLISRNDYHRARIELMRLNSYYPAYLNQSVYYVSELYLLYGEGLYEESVLAAARLSEIEGGGRFLSVGAVFSYDSYAAGYRISESAMIFEYDPPENDPLRRYIDIRKTHCYIAKGDYKSAGRLIEEQEYLNEYKYLIDFAREKSLNKKNLAAATAWGLIPGMGFVYSGETETGITALIVVAINAGLSLFAFKTGNEAIGIATGSIGTFFYLGSIAGGYMAANKYNSRIEKEIYERTAEKMGFTLHREQIMKRYGIGINE